MADILIKGLDMPTKGNPLTVLIYPDGTATWKDHEYQAVPVPPHGRLGDLDRLAKVMCEGLAPSERDSGFKTPVDILRAIANAPTIIPSSEVYE